ncbi:DUF2294 family protein [Thermoleophilia bacterium SCSIO 60948]|nr:DUF2294 family protein [Thermoleophilia bacterium SCSIO 60948]
MTDLREPPVNGDVLSRISDEMVGLHKEFHGVGPSEARTVWQGDVLVCVLQGGDTRAERTLRDAGRSDAVIEQRSQWQEAMRSRFIDCVESITGRRVRAFMSGNQVDPPHMISEVFVLEPED